MIIRATGNYGFWCREDYEMEEDVAFLFLTTRGLLQSMVYDYWKTYCVVGVTRVGPFCLIEGSQRDIVALSLGGL